jgi:amino acid transporter
MENTGGVPALGHGKKLTTIDCVAQSLAVGPIFSAAALGGILGGALAPGAGPAVIWITLIGILGIGYVVSEYAKRYAGSGTVYEYIAHTLGKRAAVAAAGAYHIGVIALGGPGIAIIGGINLRLFFLAHTGLDWPWWTWALIVEAIIVAVNVIGVQISVRTQLTIIGVSLIPFLIMAIAVIADGGPSGNSLKSLNPGNVAPGGSIFKGLLFAILMFVGFELAAALGEETANPKKSIPQAVLATILIVAVFYLLTQYVGTIGSGGAKQIPFDFGPIAQEYVGRWLSVLVELAVVLDIIAVGIGFQAAGARGIFTLSRDGLLPKPLARVNARRVPANASYVVGVISVVAVFISLAKYKTGALLDPQGNVALPEKAFNAFLVVSTIGAFVIAIIYVVLCIGGLKMFLRGKNVPGVVAALVGLATAGGGVAAQFISGTAPTGDALWGRHLGLVALGVVAAWLLANHVMHPDRVDAAGQHALQHAEH